ncbi:peptidase C80 [Candidatus Williamhamiltonella defendens]|uniref:Peptidase C80 n=1 Tax=Candidatus Williamhamiltonella defendens TaxID=138072 RepID=A0A2D3T9D7_9ENTR|nr:C80 family cysteine peptidase [Candidatus Hamiltonella defensa]ATW30320.1 peptidase C80 [Candidatus Hamiltonella defensa]ATW32334.1 peptidase C80 [Candidatus Hamiltonella defensa]
MSQKPSLSNSSQQNSTRFLPLHQWDKVNHLTERPDGGSSRYAGQLIIQLENDPDILNGAVRLAQKHPGSVLIQLDQHHHYRVLSGSPYGLQGKLRWQLVGHSSSEHPTTRTLSGMTPDDLADLLKNFNQHFSEKYAVDSTPNRISLVSCQLIDYEGKNFATQFAHAMKKKGIQADISARTRRVSIPHYGGGKKFTRKTISENRAQTAGDTLLLGWNQKGELIHKKHSSAFRLLSPVLDAWAPDHFTDPKMVSETFKYLVYPSSITDLMGRKGIFSKDIQHKLRQSDVISASILSNETLRDYTVGVILEVPKQNILAAAPYEKILEANLKTAIDTSDDHLDKLATIPNTPLSELAHQGLLSKQLFSYRQRVAKPDEIIRKTTTRNTVLITGRPDVNIYPHFPVTGEIKITGLFLIYPELTQHTGEARHVVFSEGLSSKNVTSIREAAQKMAQEFNIELKIIKTPSAIDDSKDHDKDVITKMNQNNSITLSERAHDQKNPDSSLTEKLKRVWALVNGLASNQSTSFSPSDIRLLTDFFHLPSGELDWKKFYETSFDPILYSQFINQIKILMKYGETQDQFIHVTGQTTLKRTADWNAFLIKNKVNWNKQIKLYNHMYGFLPEINTCMQAIYVGDGSQLAQQKAIKVNLAYLSLLRLGDQNLRLKLLKAFQTHAQINEQKIFNQLTYLDNELPEIFGKLINDVEAGPAFIKKGPQSLHEFFNTLDNQKSGYYQLRIGQHLLSIAKRQTTNQQTHWYVYDANFGEIMMRSHHFQKTSITLRLMLNDYFKRLMYLPQKDGFFIVDVDQLNFFHIFQSPSIKKLTKFISDTDDGSLHSPSPFKPDKPQKNSISPRISKVSSVIGTLGQANQRLSWIRTVTCLSHYWRRRSSDQLSQSQKQALDFEAQIAMAGLVYDMGSELLTFGFRKLESHIIQTFSFPSAVMVSSKIQRLKYLAGSRLVRYGAPVLSILGASLDIYQAQRDITELKTTIDLDVRQDLKVSIVLSYLSVAIGISSGLALFALAGTMGLVAGAIGMTLEIALSVVRRIYFSVRQVQEIERYTRLTTLQKLRSGWLNFLGLEMDAKVLNQLAKGKAEKEAKKHFDGHFKKFFQTLLESDDEIEAVYYSTGKIILEEHRYKKLTGKRSAEFNQPVGGSPSLFKIDIEDKILPSEAERVLSEYKAKKTGNIPVYTHLSIEKSEYRFYDIEGLSATDDQISMNNEVHSESVLFVKRQDGLPGASSLSASVMKQDASASTTPHKMYFFLGDGNDEVVGHPEKSHIFDIGDGFKNFKGGTQSDTFIFRGTAPPFQPSVFDGDGGFNTLIAKKNASKTGYRVNLHDGSFYFTNSTQKIATLKNIHHIETCSDTDDVIFGNDQSNILNGQGGRDTLRGFGGNDILVAQAGGLHGGNGTDCYRVLQNTYSESALLIITEENDPEELSHVILDYSVTQISNIKRIKEHLFIELINDNQSITTLTLFDLYLPSLKKQKRTLTAQYIFYTQDGVMFWGLPAEIPFNPYTEEPEQLALIATYTGNVHKNSPLSETKSTKQGLIIQKMADQQQPGLIEVMGQAKILPHFLKLVPQESGFDDDLQGDDLSNTLHSKIGGDILEGKGGTDIYIIDDRPEGTQVRIHNYDSPEKGAPAQDIVLLPFSLDEIEIRQDDDDVVLTHLNSPTEHVNLRLMNFMKDEPYRHLSIMDKEGHIHTMGLNPDNEPDLIFNHLFPDTRINERETILSQLKQSVSEFHELEKVFNLPGEKFLDTFSPQMISV